MASRKQLKREQYTVGWLCALWKSELLAARAMLDEEHEDVELPDGDINAYTLGSINGHNIVIACMPAGQPGTISASRLVEPLKRSFPKLQMHLFVGIGGGVPFNPAPSMPEEDIFLGDVVVGWPQEVGFPAVVQYDYGRALAGGRFEILSSLDKPSRQVVNALTKLMSDHEIPGRHFSKHLDRPIIQDRFPKPASECDSLFRAAYCHDPPNASTCGSCSQAEKVHRTLRKDGNPVFHQGTILSGDQVVKDGQLRDKLSQNYRSSQQRHDTHDALCFEMEAAGVMDQTNCLVVRGIADYADSHKNSAWHGYAAATAAAFAREVLCTMKPRVLRDTEQDRSESMTFYDYPTHRIAYHVDRSSLIEKIAAIHEGTNKPTHQKVAVLTGPGGCGKTQLALHYCEVSEQSGRFGAIFWIDVSSPATLYQSFASAAKCLGNAQVGVVDDDSNVRFTLDQLSHFPVPWLLVFDNFDKLDLFDGSIRQFFPGGKYGSILVSSRVRSAAALGYDVQLSAMSETESLKLLFYGNDHLDKDSANDIALKVVRTLSCHALAVNQARAYVESRKMDLDAFLEDYEQARNLSSGKLIPCRNIDDN